MLNSYSDRVTQYFPSLPVYKGDVCMYVMSTVTYTVDCGCHINMHPYTGEIKAQVSTNEESCTRALGITPILCNGTMMY